MSHPQVPSSYYSNNPDNQQRNQQNFEDSFDGDNIDWLSIPLENDETNKSKLGVIVPPNTSLLLRENGEDTSDSHSRVVEQSENKSRKEFVTSNITGGNVLHTNQNSCQNYSHITNPSDDLSNLNTITPHSTKNIAHISSESSNKYENNNTSASSAQNPNSNSRNQNSPSAKKISNSEVAPARIIAETKNSPVVINDLKKEVSILVRVLKYRITPSSIENIFLIFFVCFSFTFL